MIRLKARASLPRDELDRKLQKALSGPVKGLSCSAKKNWNHRDHYWRCRLGDLQVAQEGIDTFITGEAPHWAAVAADELGMNLLLGGHYATEVFGVKALAAHLSKRFKIPWAFIDCPTGM
jgi:putative NIF3 family GTP cyclohydrolase 1 type 2